MANSNSRRILNAGDKDAVWNPTNAPKPMFVFKAGQTTTVSKNVGELDTVLANLHFLQDVTDLKAGEAREAKQEVEQDMREDKREAKKLTGVMPKTPGVDEKDPDQPVTSTVQE